MPEDITAIYLTASALPDRFAEYVRSVLLKAIPESQIISVSRKPLKFGAINLLDEEPKRLSNIYFQMLRAAKLATTEYVAVAEDDCLYEASHFTFYRPDPDTFAYDQNRFSLFTWGTPLYSWRNRKSNSTLIAPRKLLIEALEERFAKWPDGTPDKITGEVGRGMVERNLGITLRKSVEVFNDVSVIFINHEYGSEDRQRTHRKSYGPIRAYDVPHWGHARNILSHLR